MEKISFLYDKISGDNKSLSLLEDSSLIKVALIRNYETETVSKFTCYSADKNFGNIGSKVLDCMHGRDRKVSLKKNIKCVAMIERYLITVTLKTMK
ncbi:uncharacterized protein LOC136087620 isoform X2 [Hydra vulgaris]|uniref:Uncharacterized protein LOC136087620 isoform X2 n=1 Tax=Hydra vulgaris TaxID=6087 RepID=A0ABM4CYI2_HYDVU